MTVAIGRRGELVGVPPDAVEPDIRVAVAETLSTLRARYNAGDDSAALEAVVLVGQAARLPLGGGYRHRWPLLPETWTEADLDASISLWRGMQSTRDGAARLREARSAGEVTDALKTMLSGLFEAERGAAGFSRG